MSFFKIKFKLFLVLGIFYGFFNGISALADDFFEQEKIVGICMCAELDLLFNTMENLSDSQCSSMFISLRELNSKYEQDVIRMKEEGLSLVDSMEHTRNDFMEKTLFEIILERNFEITVDNKTIYENLFKCLANMLGDKIFASNMLDMLIELKNSRHILLDKYELFLKTVYEQLHEEAQAYFVYKLTHRALSTNNMHFLNYLSTECSFLNKTIVESIERTRHSWFLDQVLTPIRTSYKALPNCCGKPVDPYKGMIDNSGYVRSADFSIPDVDVRNMLRKARKITDKDQSDNQLSIQNMRPNSHYVSSSNVSSLDSQTSEHAYESIEETMKNMQIEPNDNPVYYNMPSLEDMSEDVCYPELASEAISENFYQNFSGSGATPQETVSYDVPSSNALYDREARYEPVGVVGQNIPTSTSVQSTSVQYDVMNRKAAKSSKKTRANSSVTRIPSAESPKRISAHSTSSVTIISAPKPKKKGLFGRNKTGKYIVTPE